MTVIDTLLNFLIPSAHAAPASATSSPPAGGSFPLIIMMVVFFLFMYFAVWRPQSKRAKEHRNLLASLAKGDEVMTAGGILGRVSKITDHYFVLTIADNVEITVQKSSVSAALPKGTLKSIT